MDRIGEPARGIDADLLKLGEAIEGAVDAELQRLDQPDELDRIRRKRLEEMKRAAAEKMAWRAKGHGLYEELPSEKDFFAVVKDSDRVVCHFNRDSSRPCRVRRSRRLFPSGCISASFLLPCIASLELPGWAASLLLLWRTCTQSLFSLSL